MYKIIMFLKIDQEIYNLSSYKAYPKTFLKFKMRKREE